MLQPMTDAKIVAAVRSGACVLLPADGEYTITRIEQLRSDANSVLEINIATSEQVRELWLALIGAQEIRDALAASAA